MFNLSPVIPRDIARAKRVAKQLHALYPMQKLAQCQATTSHLFGFKDWHAVETACKSADDKTIGPFDEQLDDSEFLKRRQAQSHILCRELGGVEPLARHDPPAEPPSKGSYTNEELAEHFAARDALIGERLSAASARWSVVYSTVVVDEIAPTAEHPQSDEKFIDFMTDSDFEYLVGLPALLGRWWQVNFPHQPEVGQALSNFKINPHRTTSLMMFSHYWGTLCVYYARTINWAMAMGVAYMLAERFGSIDVQGQEMYFDMLDGPEGQIEARLTAAMPELNKAFVFGAKTFFMCFPRDDFAGAYARQPDAFINNAEEVRAILSDPGSTKGTWASDK